MREIRNYIGLRQREYEKHPLFERMRQGEPLERMKPYAPSLAFWVMTFQDILRVNELRVSDENLRAIACAHRQEDLGHDRWFLEDLLALTGEWPDLQALYSPRYNTIRDAAYMLMSELYRAESDYCRIVLLLALEASGHCFFEHTAAYHERIPHEKPLKYFSNFHMNVEKAHDMFDDQTETYLNSLVLSPKMRGQAKALIDRVHDAFISMFDGVEAAIAAHQRGEATSVQNTCPTARLIERQRSLAR